MSEAIEAYPPRSGSALLLILKIGRREFHVTEADKFMDNGSCVQLITRKIPSGPWHCSSPVMTKKALREISQFKRIQHPHKYNSTVNIFSLQNTSVMGAGTAYHESTGSAGGGK